jgi:peptidoglycan/LPS O-acetylase OafA/YrhL
MRVVKNKIHNSKNWKLELIRGLAAITVFVNHLFANTLFFKEETWYNVITNWGTESVIIFFVLSGVVINISQENKPKTSLAFFKNRLKRIYPLYSIGILLAVIAFYFTEKSFYDTRILAGNMFFIGTLQSYVMPVLKTNAPLWSLSFEMFFYTLFTFTINRFQKYFLWIWIILGFIFVPLYYLHFTGFVGLFSALMSFSLVWLVGYFGYAYRKYIPNSNSLLAFFFLSLLPGISRLDLTDDYYDVVKYIIFGSCSIPVFAYCTKTSNTINYSRIPFKYLAAIMIVFIISLNYFSTSRPFSKLIYIGAPFICTLFILFQNTEILFRIKKLLKFKFKNIIIQLSLFIGKISFAIYICHYPIILMISFFFGIKYWWVSMPLTIVVCFSVAYFLENSFQPLIFKLLKEKNFIEEKKPAVKICENKL